MIIGDDMNNDLESRILELEKKVNKIERIYKRNLIFKIITLIITLVILIIFLYIVGSYYEQLFNLI